MRAGVATARATDRRQVAVVAAGAVALLACLRRIADPDYWTHLAFGRAFVRAGTIFLPEPFLLGFPAIPPPESIWGRVVQALTASSEWPFQVLLYGIRQAAGDVGVSLFVAACAAACAALLAARLSRDASPARVALAVACVAVATNAARFRFSPRPEALGAVLLAATILLASRWRERPGWRPLVGIAVLLLAWRSMHVTWTLGAAFAGLALLLRPRLDFWRAQPLPLRAAALGALAAAVWYAAGFARWVVALMGAGGMLSAVMEMRPTWEFPSALWPFVASSGFALALAWGGRAGRWQRLAFWAVALALGIGVVRNAAFAALAMVPVALEGLESWPAPSLPAIRPATAALAVSAATVAAVLGLALRDRDPPPGAGIDWTLFPRDAAAYVRASAVPRPVFNSWDYGGYLDWAWDGDPRTFLDGRLWSPTRLGEHDAVASGDPAPILARYGFRTVLLKPLFQNSARIVPAVYWFLWNPEWRLVRATDALVFVRRPLPPGVEAVPAPEAWRTVLRQAAALAAQSDRPAHAEYTTAVALLALGDVPRARAAFDQGVRLAPAVAVHYADVAAALGAR